MYPRFSSILVFWFSPWGFTHLAIFRGCEGGTEVDTPSPLYLYMACIQTSTPRKLLWNLGFSYLFVKLKAYLKFSKLTN